MKKHGTRAVRLPFTLENKLNSTGAWKEENHIEIRTANTEPMNIYDLALQGKHNTYNSMAAALASRTAGIQSEVIRAALADFQNIEHRLEKVLTISGIEFINDSKATNINSTWYALESINRKVVWIAGGVDKGNDYDQLIPLVKEKVKAIICLGRDNEKIINSFKDVVDIMVDTDNMMGAVRTAYNLANSGEVVLLSPACASFDLFSDYEDRGRQFKAQVRRL
jgi:UDP-N-acetylmuramoylalanine--D-glutamate ligase